MVARPPALRTRSNVAALRRVSLGVSKMTLLSKTRRRETAKAAARNKRRAAVVLSTASLISVSFAPCAMGWASLRGVAAMVVAKILVDGFAAAKPLFHSVPELDLRLPQLPAQVNFLAAKLRREIDQPDVQILHHAADRLHLLDGATQAGGRSIAPLPRINRLVAVHRHPAHHRDPLHPCLYGLPGRLVYAFQQHRVAQQAAHLRDEALCFRESESPGHPSHRVMRSHVVVQDIDEFRHDAVALQGRHRDMTVPPEDG